jgi:hypothetical protein
MADFNSVKKSFLSNQSVHETSTKLIQLLKRDATTEEVNYMVQIMKRANVEFYKKYKSISDCQNAVAQYISTQLSRNEKTHIDCNSENSYTEDDAVSDDIDHEHIQSILKKEIYNTSDIDTSRSHNATSLNHRRSGGGKREISVVECNSILGFDTSFDIVNALNPSSLSRIFPPLTLDSSNRILAENGGNSRTTMQWSFYNNTRFSQGSVNGLGVIRDIIGIECGTIYLPNFDNVAFGEYRQISMFIQEFSEQSSIINEKIRYHFLFNAEKVSNDVGSERLKLSPVFSDIAETRFERPITTLNTLTISFGNPGEKIVLGYDRDLEPTLSVAGETTEFTTSIPHGMEVGDLVYIENFTTNTPNAHSTVISEINKSTGHIVVSTSNTAFYISVNSSIIATDSVATSTGSVLFGSKRFFIPLKFKYIGGRHDN